MLAARRVELVPERKQSRFPTWTIPQAWGGHEPKFLEKKLEPGRTETPAVAPPTELAQRIGWAPHDFSHHRELNLTLIIARKFDQRIVIGSDTIMRKWAARPFLHGRRQFGRELAMSRFLQQRAGEVIEQLVDSLAARS